MCFFKWGCCMVLDMLDKVLCGGYVQFDCIVKFDILFGDNWFMLLYVKIKVWFGCNFEVIVDVLLVVGDKIKFSVLMLQFVMFWICQMDGGYLLIYGYV